MSAATATRPQWDACDRCSEGVMDAGNVHTYGGCDCECHDSNPSESRRSRGSSGPRVPAEVLARLVAPLVERDGPGAVARRCGLTERRIYGIVSGEQRWVTFAVADRLLTLGLGDPSLWRTVPELAAAIGESAA